MAPSYQPFPAEFRYSAEQWNVEPEQRNYGFAGSRYSVDVAKISENQPLVNNSRSPTAASRNDGRRRRTA
jgi:hypothetical protein